MSAPAEKQKNLALLEPHLTPAALDGVRDLWFGHLECDEDRTLPSMDQYKKWFMGGKEFDDACVARFGNVLEAIVASGAKTAHDLVTVAQPRGPLDYLGLILLLDQLSRNCYRGDAAGVVFRTFDPLALQTAVAALEQGFPDDVPELRWQFGLRPWFYLPLMHSEATVFHDKAVEEYARMAADLEALAADEDGVAESEDNEFRQRAREVVRRNVEWATKLGSVNVEYEQKHRDIIDRFGRYPHRNQPLGRESTKEEVEYLENGGETFSSSSVK